MDKADDEVNRHTAQWGYLGGFPVADMEREVPADYVARHAITSYFLEVPILQHNQQTVGMIQVRMARRG